MPAARARCAAVAACLFSTLAAPAQAQEPPESVWKYLLAKYDRDRDGRIVPVEHGRGDVAFLRLDEDGDGAITAADFEAREAHATRPEPGAREEALAALAPAFLVRGFAADPAAGLAVDELYRRFTAFDDDRDRRLTRLELDAAMEQRGVSPFRMMGTDRFGVLAWGAGVEGVEALELPGLVALFARNDEDGDGRLAGAEVPDLGKVGRRPRPREDELNARAAAGRIAPDFTLATPDGTRTVTLSSFAGDRPVALIFGSFT